MKIFNPENLAKLLHDDMPRGSKLVVAVSGGVDSICLLEFLHYYTDFELVVAHFNHYLRGDESDGDEIFVRERAQKLGLQFRGGAADVIQEAKLQKKSLELMARELRYDFLRRVRVHVGAEYITLGHHADDQVETILFRLLRGSGVKGLSGMLMFDNHLLRPFLIYHKDSLKSWVQGRSLSWREDSSNVIYDCDRNRIRGELLPLINELREGASGHIIHFTQQMASVQRVLHDLAEDFLKSQGQVCNMDKFLLKDFLELEEVVAFEVLAQIWEQGCHNRLNINHADYQELCLWLSRGRGNTSRKWGQLTLTLIGGVVSIRQV